MLFNHVPAWGFGSSPSREPIKTDSSPGPGSYKFSYRARKGPSWGMGSSNRGTIGLKSDSPGPGAYSIKSYSRGPKFSMRFKPNSSSELRNRSRSPGPIYLPKIRSGSPKYSMQGKYKYKKNLISDTPGPDYNIGTKNLRKAPAYTFSHAKTEVEENRKGFGPGPGQYNLEKGNDKPKYGFGTSTRDAAGSDEVPGPGQYPYKSTVGEGAKITIAQRLDYDPTTKEQIEVPGPGNYEVRKGPSGPLYSIGTSNRGDFIKGDDGPGPAGYALDSGTAATRNKNPAWKIGTGNRGELADGDKNVPGVGRYDISKKMKGPYYSITGKGNMNDIKDNGVPGSNAYLPNLNDLRKAPAYSFTHATEPDDSKNAKYSPGPGAYNLEKDNDKPKYGFGTAVRDKETKNEVPGPGQYPYKSTVGEGAKITMSKRLDYDPTTKEQIEVPGPGNYDVRKGPSGPLYSIGTSQRPEMVKTTETPGPADYTIDPGTVATRNKNPAWAIGTGNRSDLADGDKNIPGVGTYELESKGKGPYYSITGKGNMNDIKDNGVPGSNAYLPNLNDLRKAPAYSFTKAKLDEDVDPTKVGPGPGQYKLDKDNDKPKYSFGKELKNKPLLTDPNPGPGEYPYKSTVGEGAKITIAERHPYDPEEKERERVPGPGNYDVRTGPVGPLYSIGTSTRPEMVKGTATPGPADYTVDPGTVATRNKNPAWKIGTGNRSDLADGDKNIPGVGTYELESKGKGPYYSITGKGNMNDIKDNGVPGANKYLPNLNDLRKAPAYSFTHAPIGENIDPTKQPPGPGQYNLEKGNDKPKYSFGKDDRSQSTIDEVPGPGQYPYKSSVGEGPKISIADKLYYDPNSKERKHMPGPGEYNLKSEPNGPYYSIGTSQRPEMVKKKDSPGPADYKTDNLNMIRNKNPEWKIGTGNRTDLADDKDVPGAGAYYKPELPKGPYYSITGKGNMNDIKDNGVPGSNAYLPNLNDLRKAPAYSFTHAPIGENIDPTKQPPGPGQYNLEKDNDKPKYSFGKELKNKPLLTDPNPGPGEYPYKSTVGEGAKITIAERHPYDPEEKEREGVPGPGNYKVKEGDKGPKYSMGTSQRPAMVKKTDTPGPADYKPEKDTETVRNKNPAWKIGTGNRSDLAEGDKDVPGAGKYYKPELPKGPYYSITGKGNMNDIKDNGVPGANAYLPNLKDLKKAPAYTFTKAPIEPKEDPSKQGPGPGAYNLEKDNDKPKYGFGTSSQRPPAEEENSPGPGKYPIKSTVGEGAKITIAEKLPYDPTSKEKEAVPGPGNYKVKEGDKGPKYSIGKSTRPEMVKKTDTPGPADYTLDKGTKATKNKNPEWKIGTGNRGDLAEGDKDVPGAGEYYKPELPKGPYYSITGKGNMNDIKDNGVPGSNKYDIEKSSAAKKKNPSWKIGTSARDDVTKKKIKENVPGPGTYEQEDKTKVKHPEFKFGTGKRNDEKPNDVPGPGSYRIPCSIVDLNDYTREQGDWEPEYRYV